MSKKIFTLTTPTGETVVTENLSEFFRGLMDPTLDGPTLKKRVASAVANLTYEGRGNWGGYKLVTREIWTAPGQTVVRPVGVKPLVAPGIELKKHVRDPEGENRIDFHVLICKVHRATWRQNPVGVGYTLRTPEFAGGEPLFFPDGSNKHVVAMRERLLEVTQGHLSIIPPIEDLLKRKAELEKARAEAPKPAPETPAVTAAAPAERKGLVDDLLDVLSKLERLQEIKAAVEQLNKDHASYLSLVPALNRLNACVRAL